MDEWWRELPAHSQRRARRMQAYNGILYAGWIAAALYTALLTVPDSFPAGAALRDAWITETRPVTSVLCHIVWAIYQLNAELIRRGFSERAALASNVVAFQWLIIGSTTIATVALRARGVRDPAVRDALRKRREAVLQSYRAVARSGDTGGEELSPAAIWVMIGIVFLVWPWFWGASALSSSKLSYDIASSDAGLFIPFLLDAWMWGCGFFLFGLVALGEARSSPDQAKA